MKRIGSLEDVLLLCENHKQKFHDVNKRNSVSIRSLCNGFEKSTSYAHRNKETCEHCSNECVIDELCNEVDSGVDIIETLKNDNEYLIELVYELLYMVDERLSDDEIEYINSKIVERKLS
jgi:hypothetical protein